MSRETEKMFKQLHTYLEKNGSEDMDEAEMNSKIQDFMQQYNNSMPNDLTEETAETPDDFVELAETADDEKRALKYAKKALQLDPDNLDAERIIAGITARSATDLLDKLKCAVAHGGRVMEEQGYGDDDSIGVYWGITETRPYMRLRMEYMNALKDNGMIRRAISECEDMIRLCENDNLGVRFILMHLYALMEEEEKALALLGRYNAHEETQMLLPISVLYFKLGDMEQALVYLKRLYAVNKDTKKFVRAVVNNRMDSYINGMSDLGYRPFTIEELMTEMMENSELFVSAPGYFGWANEQLTKRK